MNDLNKDIKEVNSCTKALIFADKSKNLYEVEKDTYEKMIHDSITKTYKKADPYTKDKIDTEAKTLATKLHLDDKMEVLAKQQAFITLKDHKDDFVNNPKNRLINPTKSEMGMVSKTILESINSRIRNALNVNQWRKTDDVIKWFINIPDKENQTFTVFDIAEFYPSISEDLLKQAIEFAKNYTEISDGDLNIINHSRKSLLFHNNEAWEKKTSNNLFDVTMGSYDGAEICELVGLLVLYKLGQKYNMKDIGLYRDDGLSTFRNTSGPQAERIKKEITKIFKELNLNITIECNKKIVNFLDITLDLNTGKYYPYKKPNDEIQYINKNSNHPPNIIKELPKMISRRLSNLSYDEDIFKKSKPIYEKALRESGYDEELLFNKTNTNTETPRRNRKRNIIWYNPPFSKNVETNIARSFLNLIRKHFPPSNKYHKIFNKNNVKVSYSCMENMETKIKKHNKKIIYPSNTELKLECNCRNKEQCPFQGNCREKSVIYECTVITKDERPIEKAYKGVTEGEAKQRVVTHNTSFINQTYRSSSELSKYIWELKDKGKDYEIKWKIIDRSNPYINGLKRCNLCTTEKLHIINSDCEKIINKRSELISKCRHENKFYLSNYKSSRKKPRH